MQVVLVILSVGLLGLIIYYAVSPKSSRFLRLAALIALGLIGLSLGVSGIILLLKGVEQSHEEPHLPIFLDVPQTSPNRGITVEAIVFTVIFVFLLAFISIVAYRDYLKRKEEAQKAGSARIFHDESNEPLNLEEKDDSAEKKEKGKDEFDLGLD